ncbi:MAG: HlyC/CorC family transporter [Spirochaetaceae bacterium]|nr:MAG: HlyC/CorC family transporter [Spirochaetaceae bacterium]
MNFFRRFLHRARNVSEYSSEEQDMIRGIVDLSSTTVKEVMVPRIDVAFVSLDMETDSLFEKISESGYSRYPVYRETIDNVVGMLYAKDVLQSMIQEKNVVISRIIRKPFFVPESMRLDSLLREMKRRRVHIAISVDEYGGVSGIVSMEDIIEEIIGDIQDEFDNEQEEILKIDAHTLLCDARTSLEDLSEMAGVALDDGSFETLGGYVFDLFGKIPAKFEKVQQHGIDFIIQEMDGHKIRTVKVVVPVDQQPDTTTEEI